MLKELHFKLHEKTLRPYQSPRTIDGSYMPHITVGRFKTQEEMMQAYNDVVTLMDVNDVSFENAIDQMIIEVIGENEASIIESTVLFGNMSEVKSGCPVKGINHITFAVSNLGESIVFYNKLFDTSPVATGGGLAYYDIEGVWFALNVEKKHRK